MLYRGLQATRAFESKADPSRSENRFRLLPRRVRVSDEVRFTDNLLMFNTRLAGVLPYFLRVRSNTTFWVPRTIYLLVSTQHHTRMLVTLDGMVLFRSIGGSSCRYQTSWTARRITGFQHTPPQCFAAGERAELVDGDQYEAVPTCCLLVVLKRAHDRRRRWR